MKDTTTLVLPLMMYGKIGNVWHEPDQYIKKKVKVDEVPYKSGKNKGKMRPVYEWRISTRKQKVRVGYEGVYKRGKNKGKPKPVYETRDIPIESHGMFPSENRIFIQARGAKFLSEAAMRKITEWQVDAKRWAMKNDWKPRPEGQKVAANMTFYLPDVKVVRDTHNAKKLLMDALQGIIHLNDMWIIDRTIDFDIDPDNPRIEIDFDDAPECVDLSNCI